MAPDCFINGLLLLLILQVLKFLTSIFDVATKAHNLEEAWRTQHIPHVYNITSCGRQGARQPTSDDCENFYNQRY